MEIFMDQCMEQLLRRLDKAAQDGEAIDLKTWIAFFVMDVLGELAFSKPFGVLDSGDVQQMPPIHGHVSFNEESRWPSLNIEQVLLATVTGQLPWLIPYVNRILPWLPIPRLKKMINGRLNLRQVCPGYSELGYL